MVNYWHSLYKCCMNYTCYVELSWVEKRIVIILLIVLLITSVALYCNAIPTLKFVQIVHRPGQRTPYLWNPKDPYKLPSEWPDDVVQLNLFGKKRMYKMGLKLAKDDRNSTNEFCNPRQVYIICSASVQHLFSIRSASVQHPNEAFKVHQHYSLVFVHLLADGFGVMSHHAKTQKNTGNWLQSKQ